MQIRDASFYLLQTPYYRVLVFLLLFFDQYDAVDLKIDTVYFEQRRVLVMKTYFSMHPKIVAMQQYEYAIKSAEEVVVQPMYCYSSTTGTVAKIVRIISSVVTFSEIAWNVNTIL
jgi:hypothetical protein